ncbi:MAG: type IV toxin-antitoxin system AbiEi family antitoxin domain-containing protein [Spirochaetota bacterium]
MLSALLREVVDQIPRGVFTTGELGVLGMSSRDSVYGATKRALKSGDFIRLRRGLYALAPYLRKRPVEAHLVAQDVYGPSYVSLETALSMHLWIPEGVFATSCVTSRPPLSIRTPLGYLDYERSRQTTLFAGVRRYIVPMGDAFYLATPLKALADYVDVYEKDWTGTDPLSGSLRIETDSLAELTSADFDELEGVYLEKRTARFLAGLRKELGL